MHLPVYTLHIPLLKLTASIALFVFPAVTHLGLLVLLLVLCYACFRYFKTAPVAIRRLSLGLLIGGLIVIEIALRKAGGTPGLTVAYQNGCPVVKVIPPAQLQVQKAMQCDSFGINTFCPGLSPDFKVAPLNSDGFRCAHEFTQQVIDSAHSAGKKVLFFIGDSWTYGLNADSGKCYVSVLNTDSHYLAMNAGIAGTDLPQYKAIVKKYIAGGILKPDHVIVCISRNDIKHIPDRVLTPNIPMVYYTNAGGLYSFQPNGKVYATAADTYRYILNNYTLVGILGDHWYTYVLGKSVLLSRFIGGLQAMLAPPGDRQPAPHIQLTPTYQKDPTQYHINSIKAMCDSAGIPVTQFLLPSRFAIAEKQPPAYTHVYALSPGLLPLHHYRQANDDHPDNAGHYKLAAAMQHVIDSVQHNPAMGH